MTLEWLYVLILSISLIINLIATGLTYSRRIAKGGSWFAWVNLINAIAVMSYLFFSVFEDPDIIFFWVRIRMFALSLIPLALLLFVLNYTENRDQIYRYVQYSIIIPIITNLVVWFAPHLFWLSWTYSRPDLINLEAPVFTGWFWVHSVYGILGLLISSILMIRYALQATHQTKRQAYLMAVAISIPSTVVLLPVLGVTRNLINPFPISLTIAGVIVSITLFNEGLLRLSPLAYHTILEEMQDAVMVLDAQNRLLHANKKAVEVFRIPDYPKVLNQKLIEIFPEERAFIEAYKDLWEGRFNHEFNIQGHNLIFDIRVSSTLNPQGQQEYKLAVMRDITEIRQTQQAQLKLELELERSELLKRFIQNTAHEFRTPLSTIGATSFLIKADNDAEKRKQRVQLIQEQIDRITQLVDMMMKMSTLDSTIMVNREQTNLRTLIAGIQDTWKLKTTIPIHVHYVDESDILLSIDALLIQESLYAILDNAIRFGGEDNQIDIIVRRTPNAIILVIKDKGIGIEADDLTHIFDTFWRKDTAHTSPGLGLGLPIVKRIITLHEGDIQVTSKLNLGTCITITLPIQSTNIIEQYTR